MTISFAGLASGFKSEEYITAVMKQASIPMNKIQTKKSNTEAFKGVFNSLNTKLKTLSDAATALNDKSNFQLSSVSSSDPTKLNATIGDNAISGSYQVTVKELAQKQIRNIADSKTKISDIPAMMSINGIDVDISKAQGASSIDEALSIISNQINSTQGIQVNASLIQKDKDTLVLSLSSKETGEANKFTVIEKTAAGVEIPSIFNQVDAVNASDATIIINNLEIKSSTNTVKNAILGVTLDLNDKGSSTVKITKDTNKIADKVDAFVKAYNDIIKSIRENTQKSVKNSNGTQSLTLMGDSTLRDLQTQMGNMMNSIVGQTDGFKLLSDIGLEIDKGITSASLMTGEITFDKDKFKGKLDLNPEALQKMLGEGFTKKVLNSDGTPVLDKDNNPVVEVHEGLGSLFKNQLGNWTRSVDGVITMKIKGYSDDVKFMTDQIESMQQRLDMREASLKRKYANLEVVMSGLNSQKDYIAGQTAQFNKKN